MRGKNKLLIEYTTIFNRQRKAAPLEIKVAFRDALDLFIDKPSDPSLRNHALREKFTGYRSIDITSDWRAIYKEKTSGTRRIITFHLLGTHKKLYG